MLPLNPALRFDAAAHTYTLAGRPLVSVSAWGKQFCAAADMAAVARDQVVRGKYAFAEEALGTWDWEAGRGTLVHAGLENLSLEGVTPNLFLPVVPLTPSASLMVDAGYDWLAKMIRLGYEIVGIEYRAASLRDGIAGTMDLLLRAPSGGMLVVDWKTCRRLWTRAFVDEATGELPMLREPFNAFQDCKLDRYAVSLAAYRHLLAANGYPTLGAVLVHLPPDGSPAVLYATAGALPGLRPRKLPDALPALRAYLETRPVYATPAAA